MNTLEKMSSNFKIMFAGETILFTNDLFEEAPLIEALANYEKGPVTIFHSNSREVIMLNHGDDIPSMVSGFIASTHSTSGSAGGIPFPSIHSTSGSEEVFLASLLSRSISGSSGGGPFRSTYSTSGSVGGGPFRSTYPTSRSAGGGPPGTRSEAGGDLGRSIYSTGTDIRLDPVTGFLSVFGSPILGGSPTSGSNSCSKCGHDFRRCGVPDTPLGRKYKMRRNGLTSTDHRECGSYNGSICCHCRVNEGWEKENHWPPSK